MHLAKSTPFSTLLHGSSVPYEKFEVSFKFGYTKYEIQQLASSQNRREDARQLSPNKFLSLDVGDWKFQRRMKECHTRVHKGSSGYVGCPDSENLRVKKAVNVLQMSTFGKGVSQDAICNGTSKPLCCLSSIINYQYQVSQINVDLALNIHS